MSIRDVRAAIQKGLGDRAQCQGVTMGYYRPVEGGEWQILEATIVADGQTQIVKWNAQASESPTKAGADLAASYLSKLNEGA